MHEKTSVVLIEALTRLWSRIRAYHPEVPGVILLPAPAGRGELSVLGHFAPLRWRGKKTGEVHHHEVVVIAEHLDRGPAEVLGTLLHEAAHALNFERGRNDCTKSQYHNQLFKAAAEEVGLTVENVRHYGYALTRLKPDTLKCYEEDITYLAEISIHRRKPVMTVSGPTGEDSPPPGEDKPSSRLRKATCQCPFIIRLAKATIDQTSIRCETCGEAFKLA